MSEHEDPAIPPQPADERAKLTAFWTVLAVSGIAVALADSPYDLRRQSPIMVKGEIVVNLNSARRTFKRWPVDEHDKEFAFAERGNHETPTPTFKYVETTLDEKEPSVEFAHYDLKMRGEQLKIKVRYNPNEKPKRRFF